MQTLTKQEYASAKTLIFVYFIPQFIVPILMQTLTKQEEFDDEDEWNPCKAAGVCLMLIATCCEDDVVQHVLPFVKVGHLHLKQIS